MIVDNAKFIRMPIKTYDRYCSYAAIKQAKLIPQCKSGAKDQINIELDNDNVAFFLYEHMYLKQL